MTRTPSALVTRAAAIAAVGLLVTLGPAGAPVFAAQPDAASWAPPPVDMAALGHLLPEAAKGTPDDPFTLSGNSGCITTGVGNVTLTDRPPAQNMLNIDAAQQFSRGQGVTVAVIDTGVNKQRFLTTGGRLENGGDYILPDGTALKDCDGHGTIVAGIIAADTTGAHTAFTGVAPAAKILAIKHTSEHYEAKDNATGQTRTAGDLTTLAEAIRYAADQPAVKVITMSVDECIKATDEPGVLSGLSAMELQAAIHYAYAIKDKVVVAAAGNLTSGQNTDQNGQQASACQNVPQNNNPNPNEVNQVQIPPVYSNEVVSVASVNPLSGEPSPFTVWGPWVTVAAPGQYITSVDPGPGGQGLSNSTIEGGQPVPLQGTSFAAPYVAGVIALVRSYYPKLSAQQVVERIEDTAQHPSGPGGRNNEVGYGVIDPVAALTASIPGQGGVPPVPTRNSAVVLPMAAVKDWTPIRVALIGTGGGVALLLVTLFVVRSLRRNRVERSV